MFFLLFNSYSLSPTMYSLISLNSQEAKLLREREREREREKGRETGKGRKQKDQRVKTVLNISNVFSEISNLNGFFS